MNELIAACRAAPDDDAPRLVWADELLERGDAMGELIATQCALAKGGLSRERSLGLRRREDVLLADRRDLDGIEGIHGPPIWSRGAIEEITIDVDAFLRQRKEIFERAPLLRSVRLKKLPEVGLDAIWSLVAQVLESRQIDGLMLGTAGYDPQLVIELAHKGHLPRIRRLELKDMTIEAALQNDRLRDIDDLALIEVAAPFLHRSVQPTNLRPRRLLIHSHSQQARHLEIDALAPPSFFERLEQLQLGWFVRPGADIQGSPAIMQRLRRLRLPMGIVAGPLSFMTNPDNLANLEELSVAYFGNQEDVELGPIIQPGYFGSLRVLRIGPGLMTPARVLEIVRSPLGAHLEVLDLRTNSGIGESARRALEKAWDGLILI